MNKVLPVARTADPVCLSTRNQSPRKLNTIYEQIGYLWHSAQKRIQWGRHYKPSPNVQKRIEYGLKQVIRADYNVSVASTPRQSQPLEQKLNSCTIRA